MTLGNPQLPIGVFDSGLGGLTVVRALRERLPAEDVLYLGDTARVPYGTRSEHTIRRYASACARMLLSRGIKVLVVACNTVSATALEPLREEVPVPVLGVIEPGARAACAVTRSGHIGVLGTAGTVASGAYPRAVRAQRPDASVHAVAAPLLVPLVEEGWLKGEVPELAVARYVGALAAHTVDTVVLGCTHYPMLRDVIARQSARLLSPDAHVVDSAEATVVELESLLHARGLAQAGPRTGDLHLLVTDRPRGFAELAARFLGHAVDDVEVVDL